MAVIVSRGKIRSSLQLNAKAFKFKKLGFELAKLASYYHQSPLRTNKGDCHFVTLHGFVKSLTVNLLAIQSLCLAHGVIIGLNDTNHTNRFATR